MTLTRRQLERDYHVTFTPVDGEGSVRAEVSFRAPAEKVSRPVGIVGDVLRHSTMSAAPVVFRGSSEAKAVAQVNSWLSTLRRRKGWEETWRANGWPTGEAKPKRKRTTKPAGDEPLIAA